jgi:hypothetical protein
MYAIKKEKCVDVQLDATGGASASSKFPGMIVGGVEYAEKEPAAKALLEACTVGYIGKNEAVYLGRYTQFLVGRSFRRAENIACPECFRAIWTLRVGRENVLRINYRHWDYISLSPRRSSYFRVNHPSE